MDPPTWTARDLALLGLTLFAWGTNYLFVRVGLLASGPLWLAALRAGCGLLALVAYLALVRPTAPISSRGRTWAILLGVPNTAGLLGFWFLAAASVPPGQTAVVIYTYPLWVALLSIPMLGIRLGIPHWAAICGGFLGVFLVSQPWAVGTGRIPLVPLLELLAAATSWGAATVVVQWRFHRDEMPLVNAYQLMGGTAVLFAAAAILEPHGLPSSRPDLWVSVAWMGVYGTAFAYAVWFYLLGRVPAPTLSAYAFLVPLIALGASAALLGERLDVVQAIGVGLVVASVYGIARAGSGRGPTRNGSRTASKTPADPSTEPSKRGTA